MAGTEFSGPYAAVKNLYFNKTNIICEKNKTNSKIFEKALKDISTVKYEYFIYESRSS